MEALTDDLVSSPNLAVTIFRRTHTASLALVFIPDWDDAVEADFLRDAFQPTGPALRLLEIETAFRRAGYAIRKTEVSPHKPPVAVLRLIRRTAPQFPDQVQFVQHVRQILESVGIDVPMDSLITQIIGNTILIAFLWQSSFCGYEETGWLDESLASLP